jgi:hypothetical protein
MAPAVTVNDATIRGHIPISGGVEVGYQVCPKRNELSLTLANTGIDSLKSVMMIPTRKTSEANARVAKVHS